MSYIKIQTQFKLKITNQSEQTKFQFKKTNGKGRSRREEAFLNLENLRGLCQFSL